MPEGISAAEAFSDCLDRSVAGNVPFRDWLLSDMLPSETCAAVDALPVTPPPNPRDARQARDA